MEKFKKEAYKDPVEKYYHKEVFLLSYGKNSQPKKRLKSKAF